MGSGISGRLAIAIGGIAAVPALMVMGMFVAIATDGSNDRHRDFSDVIRGILVGLPIAVVTWLAFSTALLLVAQLSGQRRRSSTRTEAHLGNAAEQATLTAMVRSVRRDSAGGRHT